MVHTCWYGSSGYGLLSRDSSPYKWVYLAPLRSPHQMTHCHVHTGISCIFVSTGQREEDRERPTLVERSPFATWLRVRAARNWKLPKGGGRGGLQCCQSRTPTVVSTIRLPADQIGWTRSSSGGQGRKVPCHRVCRFTCPDTWYPPPPGGVASLGRASSRSAGLRCPALPTGDWHTQQKH